MPKFYSDTPSRRVPAGLAKPLSIIGLGISLGLVALASMLLLKPQPAGSNLLAAAISTAEAAELDPGTLVERGRLYVPVYSSIAAGSGATRIDLTATLSIRNLSQAAAVLIEAVDYHDTAGALVRAYLDAPRTLAPLGTVEIVIADKDVQGGTGAKFLVDWAAPAGAPPPLAEAVMIGISGTQGFSIVSPARPSPRPQ